MKTIGRLVVVCFLLSIAMVASPINIGFISLDTLILGVPGFPGVNAFTVANLTGDPAAGGYALPADFPVFTSLLLQDSELTVFVDGGSELHIPLGTLTSGFQTAASLEFPETTLFSKTRFTATVSPVTLTLDDGSLWSVNSSSLDVEWLPSAGTVLEPGLDLVLLTIDASPQTAPIPEPATWSYAFMALVVVGLMRRNFRRARICSGTGN